MRSESSHSTSCRPREQWQCSSIRLEGFVVPVLVLEVEAKVCQSDADPLWRARGFVRGEDAAKQHFSFGVLVGVVEHSRQHFLRGGELER